MLSFAHTVLLSGCQSQQLPTDARLVIAPSSRTFEIISTIDTRGLCVIDDTHYLDVPVVVSARDGQGVPLAGVSFDVYADYSGTTYPGSTVLTLFHDRNGNGLVDAESESVSDVGDEVYSTSTHGEDGERRFFVRLNLSCPYAGRVVAFAGALTASLSIDVSAVGYRAAVADPS